MKTVLHIGCPKTGTTSLQRHLFRDLPHVHYLGHYSRLNPKLHKVPHGARDRDGIAHDWNRAVAAAGTDKRVLLYSQEKLTYYPAVLAPQVAETIRGITGDATILITIRRQQDICISTYFNYTAKGYTHDFNTFMHNGLQTLEHSPTMALREVKESLWGLWFYDALVRAWEEQFSNVRVLPLEAWSRAPEQARMTLAEVLGCGVDEVELPTARARSRASNVPWRESLPRPLAQLWKRTPLPKWITDRWNRDLDIELTAEQLRTIESTYGSDNLRLQARTGWDLGALGYPGCDR